ncbi:DNA polymerase III subunit alpha [Lysinibacillus odysseyi]|uniref:DNA-directed DNA polymerase n=1 Tax=Lysinibacillus odysseyi 34hs-1 = NBRC 100172 TaxID=1220589 RepID=A0A0A3IKA0_9BACI|nr:DNA polymerase III subunit alpha [Lysinibacillus odysseyi]KGR83238.1 DNA polymerase III subunit epsilon [Lysinibacillus odysseyi 34hs-1 = NBRC 100172]
MVVPIVYPQIRTSADLLKSTIRMEALIPFLQQQKAEACAIVNSKLYGLLPFWHATKEAGIHAVIGLSVRVQFTEEIVLPLVLYAKDNAGYQSLLKISSSVAIRSDELLPWRWLAAYATGCVAVIPAMDNHSSWLHAEAEGFLRELKQLFRSNLYIGISRKGGAFPEEQIAVQKAGELNSQIVILHESTFLRPEDHFSYEVARAIETGVKLGESLHGNKTKHQFVPTAEEFTTLFAGREEWMNNTRELLLGCQVDLTFGQTFMPKFPVEEGKTAEDVLHEHAVSGLKARLQLAELPSLYIERLQYELQIIYTMGYADYFLIVEDFMRFAREAHILTGPGRGSSASSLVAYALQITQVNPLQYDLLFERFLNPERVSLPDIDIDFVDTRRQEVIEYVAQKYGKQYVAQIITFGTLSAKAVARDVARMFNFENETLEMISKLIPNRHGITLAQAYADSQPLRDWIGQQEIRMQWFAAAQALEGLPRNASTHAAGVVLSPVPLVDVIPIEEGHEGVYLTQWPMQDVEKSGLLKMDFLGLRNLTILEQICRSISYTHNMAIDLNRLPMDDEKTFRLLAVGDTSGIFQLESEGMRGALREIKPTHFLDIVAVNALYRPGPMDFIPVYARRKHGIEQVKMPHPVLEPILSETYGVIVYQEQIMRIAHLFAGFTIGEADLLRRAVSKKNREILEQERAHFVNGALRQGHDAKTAENIYALIVRFADYGFPKSHAVAYSMISYQLAYLKANYPVNFYAALMTNATGNQDKLAQILLEAKQRGIEVLPPSIHKSARHFKVENGRIRFSLSAIKGVPQPFLQKLLAVRNERQQPFEDLFDLAVSLSAATFNRKAVEPLIKAGALDEFGRDRAVLLATIDAAVKQAELVRPNEGEDLFSDSFLVFGKPKHVQVEPIPEKNKLQFEKEVLGFYLSEHPVTKLRQRAPKVNATVQTMRYMKPNSYVKCIGMITEVRQLRTKKGELMAFAQLEDEFGGVSLTLFPKEYNHIMGRLKEDAFIFVEGFLEYRFNKPQLKVKQIDIML